MKKLGIVLINYNNSDDTVECLRSIASSTIKPYVIIIDNNSKVKPGQIRLKQAYEKIFLYLNEKNVGFAIANNIGAKILRDRYDVEYIIILNNDTLVQENTFEVLLNSLENNKVVSAISCKIVDTNNNIWYAGGEIDFQRGRPKIKDWGIPKSQLKNNQSRFVTFISGCLFMTSMKTYQKLGGFNERYFMYVEDLDLSLRMVKKGLKLYYTDETSIVHKVNSSFGGKNEKKGFHPENPNLAFHFYHKMLNRYLVMKDHLSLFSFVLFTIYYWPYFIAKNIMFLLHGRFDIIKPSIEIVREISNAKNS